MQEKWTLIEAQSQYCTRSVVGTLKHFHPADTLQHEWTSGDAQAGRCLIEEVGTSRLPPFAPLLPPEGYRPPEVEAVDDPSPPLVPPANAKEVVQEYLETYNEIGGRAALVKQAKLNPMKFYDQLLKVLMAMEAPKAAVAVQINIEQMRNDEIASLTTAELKQKLLDR